MKPKILIAILVMAVMSAALYAADLAYNALPQQGDSDLVIQNKQAVAITRMEFGNSYTNITAAGTNSLTGPLVLDRLVVGTAGATNSTLTLSDVTSGATNTIGTFTTASQVSIPIGIRVQGNLRAVAAGSPAANLTLSYR